MKKIFYIASFIFYIISIVLIGEYAFGNDSLVNYLPFSTGIISLGVLISGVIAIGYFGLYGSRARTIQLLVSGFAATIMGDIGVIFLNYARGTGLFLPAIDALYLFAGPFWFAAIINELVAARISLRSIQAPIRRWLVIVALVFIAVIWYISIRYLFQEELPALENFMRFGYMISDVSLVVGSFCLLFLIRIYRGGKLARSWTYLFLAFVLKMIGDVITGIHNPYQERGVLFIVLYAVYMGGYMFLGYTFVSLISAVRHFRKKIQ